MLTTKQKLPPAIVDTFKNGMYQTVTTKEPITVYRKFGGTDKQAKLLGGYATTISNAGRSETAVYPRWSSMQFEAVIEIPKNQSINIGKVAPQPLNKKIPKYRGGWRSNSATCKLSYIMGQIRSWWKNRKSLHSKWVYKTISRTD